jgi:membrane associated rhomboid family serine protease
MWNEMHYDSPRRHSPFSLTPWVRGLIMANAVVYLLMVTVFTGSWVVEVSAFSPENVGGRWWTFVTYMFVHGGFLHLLFNMILLFFFGPAVEERMGGRSFAAFYFTCGVGGAILSFVIAFFQPVAPFVGASGAVLGVALAFAMNWPNAPVYIFPLPMPVKVKWLVGFLVATNLLAAIANAGGGTAWLAHVGGLLFGFIYLKSEKRVVRRAHQAVRRQQLRTGDPLRHRIKEPMAAAQPGRKARQSGGTAKRYDEMDRVLDKISESGLESLTPEERKVLDEASRKLRKH